MSVAPSRGEAAHVVVRPRPGGLRPGWQRGLGGSHDPPERLGAEVGEDQREVEAEVKLVAAGSVEARELLGLEDPGLGDEDPMRIVAVGDRPPAAIDLVHLRTVQVVDLPLSPPADLGGVVSGGRRVVAELRVVDQPVRDIDPEARDAPVEPEPQDVAERASDLLVPPVEIGLLGEEVVEVVLTRRGVELPRASPEDRSPVVRWGSVGPRIRPHVPVAVRGLPRGPRVHEPRVPVARVVGNEVEEDPDAPRTRLGHELVERVEIAEVRVDVSVVGDVVAPVEVRGGVDRRQPYAIDPEPSQVIEMLDDPPEVADAVAVRVREGPNVDLVQDPVAPPGGIVVRHEPSIPAARTPTPLPCEA